MAESARQVAERLSGLVGEAERRRIGVPGALERLSLVIREIAQAASSVAPDSARLLEEDELRRMKELHGPAQAVALVMGRGHVVAGLLKFESTPDGYIEASMKTWRSNTAPVERILGRHEPTDDAAHHVEIQRFLELVDREMGSPGEVASPDDPVSS
ncbi:MAG: hypothetical protein F9K40_14640 [Kofleriaceae bacterium]|nr:MAG: hypothetical protein F9K40_14640 [Kofleriaceae bacterium]MBZ0237616.1 hypothetical protein [Kofleriaceae bacterium]